MKMELYQPKYLVRYSRGRRTSDLPIQKTWDGKSLLVLGSPARYILQLKGEKVFIRDLTTVENTKTAMKSFPKNSFNQKISLSDSNQESIELVPFTVISPVHADSFSRVGSFEIPKQNIALDDQIYQKNLKRLGASALVMFLAIFVTQLGQPDLKTNEELIPKKYAKLIMTKPKEKQHAPSSGGATQSQAQVKAVARAFQSKTVQKSIQSILRGGISKYSIMTTGKAIQNLTRSIATNVNVTGTGLDKKASDLLAGSRVGPNQLGGTGGFGSGQGLNVKGQGNGQLEIGLNTQDATVDEGLTKDEVAKVIHSHLSEIRYCYESAILKDPTLAGKVMIDFKINPTGIVPNAGVSEATLTDHQVSNCLLGKLKTWKFPQPRGGVYVAVSYPFVFKSLSR